jgi:hypothetical protein
MYFMDRFVANLHNEQFNIIFRLFRPYVTSAVETESLNNKNLQPVCLVTFLVFFGTLRWPDIRNMPLTLFAKFEFIAAFNLLKRSYLQLNRMFSKKVLLDLRPLDKTSGTRCYKLPLTRRPSVYSVRCWHLPGYFVLKHKDMSIGVNRAYKRDRECTEMAGLETVTMRYKII